MTVTEGIKYFPEIGTIFVSNDPNLWANPFQNIELRHRCFIFIPDERKMEIYFHMTEGEASNEIENTSFPCKTYFFGAYNKIEVCQMRAFGELFLLQDPKEIEDFKEYLLFDLTERTNDTNVSSMSRVKTKEKVEAMKIVNKGGMFFKFIPESYAYHVYQRG